MSNIELTVTEDLPIELNVPSDSLVRLGVNEQIINSGGGGMSDDVKQALLDLIEHLAFIDADGQDYYDALYAALYPPAELDYITAVYTQSGTVYDTDSLDSLKTDLVVTAHNSDGTSETVTTYTLSGTLSGGTSTITVSYGGKTTTFNVTVTVLTYVTDGLIHHWDAINNTGNGHDGTSSTWADLVGTNDFTINGNQIAWGTNYMSFPGVTGNYLSSAEDATHSGGNTVEVCFKPDNAQSTVVCCAFNNEGANTSTSNAFGKIVIYSDNSVNAKGQSSTTYPTGLAALTDVNSVSASYSADTTISAVYVNGVAKTASGSTHSMRGSSKKVTAGASPTNYDYAFKGKIYDIRIYNRVLTAEEVASNYQIDLTRFGLV